MNKNRIFKNLKICFVLASLTLLFSCENDNIQNSSKHQNNIAEIDAKELALSLSKGSNSVSRGIDITKTIMDATTYKTESNENAFYAINYNEGGFVVISADNRISPILAYSDDGKFSNNTEEIPDAVISWMEEEKEAIEYVKEMELTQMPEIKLEWDSVQNLLPAPTGGNNCNDTFYQKDPLVNTIWAQGATYNNLISLNCSNSSGGKAPTGCVATAMAQVMKYHQKPVNYNWSNMPYNYGTSDTQLLMKNIGLAVGMDYGCSSSGADTTTDVASAFNNDFNYHGATYTCNYSTSIITQQLNLNKPVILRGGRKRNGITWPWNYYTGGHAWVCDGYQSMMIYFRDDAGNCTGGGNGYLFLHMNWGWGGYCNGWYNAHNFNPASSTFNYKRGIVYNITPN
ncbi:MAG TPA: C10 family peptidase [Flavobacterium sp.]|jgi:hypothetical protein|nr:C10 family peptidase [Flavobacterium sp.]HQX03293.1 C10 family peptidase [Flavobacterium sp.]HRZ31683.1 C10 family peptidase [Flavobacterium sp.]HRZ74234.1 C10 family peptidase [Flavobacterium sp.]